jgi:methylated-DNA-[protein]-cysteine S-methyltransferase
MNTRTFTTNNTALALASTLVLARESTPLGCLTMAATANGLAGLWFDGQKHHPGLLQPRAVSVAAAEQAAHWLALARTELQRYFAGKLQRFTVALQPHGTPFQQLVWQGLQGIAHGRLSTYGQLAQQLGRPAAARAVGAAVGRNPLSIIVPCHRVLGQGGALTGYAGGLERKQALLQLECAGLSAQQHGVPGLYPQPSLSEVPA